MKISLSHQLPSSRNLRLQSSFILFESVSKEPSLFKPFIFHRNYNTVFHGFPRIAIHARVLHIIVYVNLPVQKLYHAVYLHSRLNWSFYLQCRTTSSAVFPTLRRSSRETARVKRISIEIRGATNVKSTCDRLQGHHGPAGPRHIRLANRRVCVTRRLEATEKYHIGEAWVGEARSRVFLSLSRPGSPK